jgi:ferredoxin-NADP reductase
MSGLHKVIEIRELTEQTYVLRAEKKYLDFKPGQYVHVGLQGNPELREYSIYSSPVDDSVEFLIRQIEDGFVSRDLRSTAPGSFIQVEGPKGAFVVTPEMVRKHKFLFLASGTGISPFHSMIKTYPKIDYRLIHGVRYTHELYDRKEYSEDRYLSCTSKDPRGDFYGRITDYLKQNDVEKDRLIYLCGNFNMIDEAIDILLDKGVDQENIFTEIYF